MFTFENDEVVEIVTNSVDRYEQHFKEDFPLQEYLKETNGLVTSENAIDFKALINKSVKRNETVKTPKDFHERLY